MLWVSLFLCLYHLSNAAVIDFASCCKDPGTSGAGVEESVNANSPYYGVVVPRTPKMDLVDNICYTFFENEEGDILNAISVVYKNGASEQHFFSVDDYDEAAGVSISKGPGCSFLDYPLEVLCCEEVLTKYRCFVSSDPCTDYEIDIGCIPGLDVRFALSTSPYNSCDCADSIFQSLLSDDRFCGNDFILLPNLLCPQCVTEYNCKDAIRADCAVGEICVKDCCRLTPFLSPPLPAALLPPPLPAIHKRRHSSPLNYFFG